MDQVEYFKPSTVVRSMSSTDKKPHTTIATIVITARLLDPVLPIPRPKGGGVRGVIELCVQWDRAGKWSYGGVAPRDWIVRLAVRHRRVLGSCLAVTGQCR